MLDNAESINNKTRTLRDYGAVQNMDLAWLTKIGSSESQGPAWTDNAIWPQSSRVQRKSLDQDHSEPAQNHQLFSDASGPWLCCATVP